METRELERVLASRGYEVVSSASPTPKQLRLLGRVPRDVEAAWRSVVDHVLAVCEKPQPWSVDVSKSYFRRAGRLLYAWRIIFQGEGLEGHLGTIAGAFSTAPRPKASVEEYTIQGGPNRNALKSGKGVQSALNPVVGPAAARR